MKPQKIIDYTIIRTLNNYIIDTKILLIKS